MGDGTRAPRRAPATSRPGDAGDFTAMPNFLAAEGGPAGLSECGLRLLCEAYSRSRSAGGVLTAGVDRLAAKARASVDEAAAAMAELSDAGLIQPAPGGGWVAVPERMDRLRGEYLRYWDAKERLAALVDDARSAVRELRAAGGDAAELSAAGAAGAEALCARGLSADDFEAAADELSRLLAAPDGPGGVPASGDAGEEAREEGDSDPQPHGGGDLGRPGQFIYSEGAGPGDGRGVADVGGNGSVSAGDAAQAASGGGLEPRPPRTQPARRDCGRRWANSDPDMPELSEFEGLDCPASAAREALSQMLDDNPNPHRVQFAPRAYLELLREGAEPWAVLACWRRRRRQAGRRDPLFQPQLAAWLAAPAEDPKGARAALARMAEREASRENAARSAAAGELYASSEEFRAAYDEAHDPDLGPMARAKAQARAHAMLERKLGENP